MPTEAVAARVAAAVLVLLVGACGGGPSDSATVARTAEPPAPAETASTPSAPSPTTPNDRLTDLAGRAPLTGLPAPAELVPRPAVVVPVANEPGSRPQRGVEQADVVFVAQVGPTTTRLAAVFHTSLPAEVGPVRSALPTDGVLAGPAHGVLASAETPAWVRTWVGANVDVDDLGTPGGSAAAYGLDSRRRAGDRVVVDPAALVAQATRTAPPPALFSYALEATRSSAATAGSPAGRVDLGYGEEATAWWTYDAATGRWLRSESAGPHLLESGAQVGATNVLALHTRRDTTSFPEAGAQEVVLDLDQAGGELELLSGPAFVRGTWTKAGLNDPLVLLDAVGKPLLLAQGTTWVECVSETVPVVVGSG